MLGNIIAGGIMASILSSAKKQVLEIAKSQIIKTQKEALRKDLLAKVTAQYTREAEYNFSQYIESLASVEAEINFEGKPGEAFINKAQTAVEELESYIDNQTQEGAVIQFLKRRYGEEKINIITGRLYAGHYVGRKSQGVYEIANKMGYAGYVDNRKPWLSSERTIQGIQEILENSAQELFELVFEDVDLSSEISRLKVSGLGFKPTKEFKAPSIQSKPKSKGKKKKKK